MTRWLSILLLTLSLTALAATDAEKEAATRFQRGVSLYKDGDYEAALTEFKQAYRLAPSFEVLYNIGLTQRRLYEYGEAVRSLNEYLQQGGKKVTAQRRDAVRKELEEIRQLTAEVTVVVQGSGEATLSVDGKEVAKSPLKEPLLLRPGKHTITATRGDETASETQSLLTGSKVTITLEPKRAEGKLVIESDPAGAIITVDGALQGEAPVVLNAGVGAHTINADKDGYQTANLEVTLTEGQSRNVTVKLTPASGDSGGSGEPSARRRVPLAGIIVSAAGLALIGGGVAFNFSAQGAAKQTTALFANGGVYDEAAQRVEAGGQTASALSWVFGVTGGVTLTTGLIVLFAELFSGSAEPEVSFFIAPGGQGLGAAWRCSW
ncbi:MAG: PEGA domain-containing protein [Myxococcota bacterium]